MNHPHSEQISGTALLLAAYANDAEGVRLLCQAGADPNTKNMLFRLHIEEASAGDNKSVYYIQITTRCRRSTSTKSSQMLISVSRV